MTDTIAITALQKWNAEIDNLVEITDQEYKKLGGKDWPPTPDVKGVLKDDVYQYRWYVIKIPIIGQIGKSKHYLTFKRQRLADVEFGKADKTWFVIAGGTRYPGYHVGWAGVAASAHLKVCRVYQYGKEYRQYPLSEEAVLELEQYREERRVEDLPYRDLGGNPDASLGEVRKHENLYKELWSAWCKSE